MAKADNCEQLAVVLRLQQQKRQALARDDWKQCAALQQKLLDAASDGTRALRTLMGEAARRGMPADFDLCDEYTQRIDAILRLDDGSGISLGAKLGVRIDQQDAVVAPRPAPPNPYAGGGVASTPGLSPVSTRQSTPAKRRPPFDASSAAGSAAGSAAPPSATGAPRGRAGAIISQHSWDDAMSKYPLWNKHVVDENEARQDMGWNVKSDGQDMTFAGRMSRGWAAGEEGVRRYVEDRLDLFNAGPPKPRPPAPAPRPPAPAPGPAPVKADVRVASDGNVYTRQEFVDYYGERGDEWWDQAERPKFQSGTVARWIAQPAGGGPGFGFITPDGVAAGQGDIWVSASVIGGGSLASGKQVQYVSNAERGGRYRVVWASGPGVVPPLRQDATEVEYYEPGTGDRITWRGSGSSLKRYINGELRAPQGVQEKVQGKEIGIVTRITYTKPPPPSGPPRAGSRPPQHGRVVDQRRWGGKIPDSALKALAALADRAGVPHDIPADGGGGGGAAAPPRKGKQGGPKVAGGAGVGKASGGGSGWGDDGDADAGSVADRLLGAWHAMTEGRATLAEFEAEKQAILYPAAAPPPPPPPAASSGGGAVSELLQLWELKKDGCIDAEEFQNMKAELLSGRTGVVSVWSPRDHTATRPVWPRL